ncbi:hypothetical protein Bpfe_004688 [Biomphalaria pfeifferi]|uniref:Uncharacterized protein n=1 Tax=Biomphalaria pfeifferi TaxID=112525 RepID=A0AAD8C3M9_BIOPF|nr:hypothetical protein Bpfe_004688 [Biomphalaria pfeifferi]
MCVDENEKYQADDMETRKDVLVVNDKIHMNGIKIVTIAEGAANKERNPQRGDNEKNNFFRGDRFVIEGVDQVYPSL